MIVPFAQKKEDTIIQEKYLNNSVNFHALELIMIKR